MPCPIIFSRSDSKLIVPIANGFIIGFYYLLRKNYNKKYNSDNKNKEYHHPIMDFLISSLGMILAIIPHLITIKRSMTEKELENLKKKQVEQKEVKNDTNPPSRNKSLLVIKKNNNDINSNRSESYLKIELLYNEYSNGSTKITITFIAFLILINSLQTILSSICLVETPELSVISTNMWCFAIIILAILSKFALKIKIYKHQIISLIFIFIQGITILVLVIIKGDFQDPINIINIIKIICLLLKDSFTCITLCTTNYLITHKFTPLLKLCFIIGLVRTIISIIIFIIVTFIPCGEDYCQIKYNNSSYFDNIIVFTMKFKLSYFIVYFFVLVLLAGLYNIFLMITVSYFPPTHCLITFIIKYCFLFIVSNPDKIYKGIYAIVFGLYVSEILTSLIYYEILVIKWCGLADNTKKQITERSYLEKKNSYFLNDESEYSNDEDEENDISDLELNTVY